MEKEGAIDWETLEPDAELVKLISFASVERYGFLPFEKNNQEIKVAVLNWEDVNVQNALNFLSKKFEKKLRIFPISQEYFSVLLKKAKKPIEEISQALKDLEQTDREKKKKSNSAIEKRKLNLEVIQEAPVAKMIEVILKNAIDGKASDIHIEPMEDNVRIRYRVDGILHSSLFMPKKVGPALVSRVKILSNLKIDEKRKPQDGRFRIDDLGKMIDFRVSTFPVSYGEKVVMRILDKSQGLVDLASLGMKKRDKKLTEEIIEEPYGIVLVTGPTGSGKSTTLYSVLKMLNREGVNIVTLEDPVEYVLDGISQSQVKPEIGYTFASGLRSILRQDPDIIMVGEIRDEETAELAIHAALTGHLVLSTLHTNTAIGAIPRLIDMGIQPFLLSSSLKLIIGQRLVRKICSYCKKEKKIEEPNIMAMVKKELSQISKEQLMEENLDVTGDNIHFYEGQGCLKCQNIGMKGREGVYEVVKIDDRMAKLINEKAGEDEFEKVARSQGFVNMKQDGIIKILKGETTLEEVQRVTEDDSSEEVIQAKGD